MKSALFKIPLLILMLMGPHSLFAQGEVGSLAPDFTLTDNNGQEHSLQDYQDKVLFLYILGYS